ncbi:ABC transporter permease [Paenibacillus spiritus]|uniref:ABC transporter permease n=1 Tax=Paenibacillus spiritus TaxID=2496557 RepID=A0A5J5FUJ2_9BACL|nr:ABC transporter permease [Paenibacillus spiritus]KAA8997215.1 ABC transporter permease [Paenibacillus spiritus]
MNNMSTVIGFTFLNKIRTKAFLVTTLIMVILISIGMNIPYMVKVFSGDDDTAGIHIAVVTGTEQATRSADLLRDYAQRSGTENGFVVDSYPSENDAALRKAMDNGDLDGYLTLEQGTGKGLPPVTFHSKDGSMGQDLQLKLQAALQQVQAQLIAGDRLTQQEITAMNTPVQLGEAKVTDGGGDGAAGGEEDSPAVVDYVIVYALMMLFFITLTTTGNMVSSEVTSEKSSRIMEILITSTSPLAQMFGKVLGIFFIGLLQIGIIAGTVAVNLMLPNNAGILDDFDIDLGQMSISLLVYGLIFYILGYFLYAMIYAALGSIVSRTEDLGQAMLPVMLLGFVNLYVPMFSISAPNTLLVKIASFVPFTSPLSMLLRIGVGEVATWEILVSLLILLVSSLVMGWLAAKIYRTGVLMYGKRPSFKELRKAMKAYKI